jgi:hypothetical protein
MIERGSNRKLRAKVVGGVLACAFGVLLPSASFAGMTHSPGGAPGDVVAPDRNATLPNHPGAGDKPPLAAQHQRPADLETRARQIELELRAKSDRTFKTLSEKERQVRTLIEQKALQDKQPIEIWGKIKELAN